MNNIFLNDPLLYQGTQSPQSPIYKTDPSFLQQYYHQQALQQEANGMKDWIGELDNETKDLDSSVVAALNANPEYTKLNESLKTMIQGELMSFVKQKLNCYPTVADNVKKQIEIIRSTVSKTKEEEKKNLYELNDYMQNYSHMSFDEYRKIKQQSKVEMKEEKS